MLYTHRRSRYNYTRTKGARVRKNRREKNQHYVCVTHSPLADPDHPVRRWRLCLHHMMSLLHKHNTTHNNNKKQTNTMIIYPPNTTFGKPHNKNSNTTRKSPATNENYSNREIRKQIARQDTSRCGIPHKTHGTLSLSFETIDDFI